ncbi:MAG: hypothetical protein Q8N59_02910, partial [bacterium]|nr:hypothetical protein [bacterium]
MKNLLQFDSIGYTEEITKEIMKYLIFGKSSGWLARKFNNFLEDSLISEVDITDLPAIRRELEEIGPEVVINAAGVTG